MPYATTTTVTCNRCAGTGRYGSYGRCFGCNGTGSRRVSPAAALAGSPRNERRRALAGEFWNDWKAEHPAEAAWIEGSQESFPFAYNMRVAVERNGDLTENQMAAVGRCMAHAAARDARAAQQAAVIETPPTVDVSRIKAALDAAAASGLRRPGMKINGIHFKRAPDSGRNPGAIYVTEGNLYLGLIRDNTFTPGRDFGRGENVIARLTEIAADPGRAAAASGLQTGACACCGRTLTDPFSVEIGIGPKCAQRFNFDFSF